jgi:hypothetical protein
VNEVYYAVTNSKFFTKRLFSKLKYPDTSYQQFIKKIRESKPINLYRHRYIPGYTPMVVDKHFGSTIVKNIQNLNAQGIEKLILKRKFNGHLIQNWVNEIKPGKGLSDLMEDLKKFIEEEFNVNFVDYLLERPDNLIRKDFLSYYYEDLDHFDRMFLEDELPF